MKLSKHGREHLGYHEAIGLGIGSYDFQQEDFQGAVVLTVEEAKEIHDMLADNENYFPEGLWDMGHWLKNKIEQAEKGNETK